MSTEVTEDVAETIDPAEAAKQIAALQDQRRDLAIEVECTRIASEIGYKYPTDGHRLIDKARVRFDAKTGKVSGALPLLTALAEEKPGLCFEAGRGAGSPQSIRASRGANVAGRLATSAEADPVAEIRKKINYSW